MRCKNCGWPNKPNEKVCVKCHAPLGGGDDSPFDGGGMPDNDGYANKPLSKTVREEDVFGMSGQTAPGRMAAEDTKTCPKCGYPVRQGSDKCPNCKFPVSKQPVFESHPSGGQSDGYDNGESKRHPTRMNNDERDKFKGTVNPYMMNLDMEPTFVLKPLKRMNERHDLEERDYEGAEVILNRGNTEPNNASITSRQQAAITRVDGRWYIEDRSEQKTTFVQAATRIELHDGDIILLGNRLFEFHE